MIESDKYTEGMKQVIALAKFLGRELLDTNVKVRIVMLPGFGGAYARRCLDLSLQSLGHRWFDQWSSHLEEVLDLLVHEFGHHYSDDHLSSDYFNALTRLAGKLACLALENPDAFSDPEAHV